MTLVLLGKGLVLVGWPSKIEVSLGSRIIYTHHTTIRFAHRRQQSQTSKMPVHFNAKKRSIFSRTSSCRWYTKPKYSTNDTRSYLWGWICSSCFVLYIVSKAKWRNFEKTRVCTGPRLILRENSNFFHWFRSNWHVFFARPPPNRNIDYPMTCSNFKIFFDYCANHECLQGQNPQIPEPEVSRSRLLHLLHVPALCREVAWVPWTSWKTHQYLAKWTLTIKGLHRRSISWKSS